MRDKDAELVGCRAEIQQRENELEIKERIIAERDGVVNDLQRQIDQLNSQLQLSVDGTEPSCTDDMEVSIIEVIETVW